MFGSLVHLLRCSKNKYAADAISWDQILLLLLISVGRIFSSFIQLSELIAGLMAFTVRGPVWDWETRDEEQAVLVMPTEAEPVQSTWKQQPVSAHKRVAAESIQLQRQISNVGVWQQPFACRHLSQVYLLIWNKMNRTDKLQEAESPVF